jgi:hypothetical protein
VNNPASKKLWTTYPWGPKGQKLQLVVMGFMSAMSGAHVMSPCHHKKGKQWLSTPLTRTNSTWPPSSSLSLPIPAQPAHYGPSSHWKLWILMLFIWQTYG